MVAVKPITWDATLSIMRELTDLYSGMDTDDALDASTIPALVEVRSRRTPARRSDERGCLREGPPIVFYHLSTLELPDE